MSKGKVIVFGGAGFLGSHTADALTKEGYDVTIFDIKSSAYLQTTQNMMVGDMSDAKQVEKAIEGMDYVYHFAGIADIKEAQEDPIATVKANVLSTIYILDACVKHNIKHFLYASTIYVYSEHGSFYRSSKQSCELFIENYHKVHNLNYTVLRYGSLYGRRANHFNFLGNAVYQALTEGKIVRKGDGKEVRDYINVLDAARISARVVDDVEYKNSYLMLTGNQTIKIKELLNMIQEMLDNQIEIEYTPTSMEGHYEITPYSFRPRVAKKVVSDYYYDLGQGILDIIYDTYKKLNHTPNSLFVK